MNGSDCNLMNNLTTINGTNTTICSGDGEFGYERPNVGVTGALFVICTWIILSNTVVVICFIVSKEVQKNKMNLHILSLSFTDFLVGFSSLVMTLSYQKPRLFSYFNTCSIVFILYVAAQIASFYHTFGICLHRFITVFCYLKSPKSYQRITKRNTLIQVVSVWIVSLSFAMIPFISFGRWGSTLNVCSLNTLFLDRYNLSLSLWNVLLLAPQIVTNIMYLTMCCKLRRTLVKVTAIPQTNVNNLQLSVRTTNEISEFDNQVNDCNTIIEEAENGIIENNPPYGELRPPVSNNQKRSEQQHSRTKGHLEIELSKRLRMNRRIYRSHGGNINMPSCSKQILEVKSFTKPASMQKRSKLPVNTQRSIERKSNGRSEDSSQSNSDNSVNNNGNHLKLLVTVGIILIVVDICLTPLNLLFVLETLQEGFLSRKIKFIVVTFSLFNSGVNPIIYAFRIRQLRESFIKGVQLMKSVLF